MAVTKSHMSDNRAASINYALGKGKMTKNADHKLSDKQKEKLKADGFPDSAIEELATSKYRAVIRSGNVALIENPELEMKKIWELKHANSKYGAEVSTQSFSESALDPRDPDNWRLANRLGQLTAMKLYYDEHDNPDNKNILYVVYTHIDNMGDPITGEYKTPKIHNHIIAMNCNIKTGKAIDYHNQYLKILKASNAVMKENNIPYINDETAYIHPEKRKMNTTKRSELGVKANLRKKYIESKKQQKHNPKNLTLLTNKEQTRMLIYEVIRDKDVHDFESFMQNSANKGLEVKLRKSPIKQGFTNVKFINHNIPNAYNNNGQMQDFVITSRANGFQSYTKEGIVDSINQRINKRKKTAFSMNQLKQIHEQNFNRVEFKYKENKSNVSENDYKLIIIFKKQIQEFIKLIKQKQKKYAEKIKLAKERVQQSKTEWYSNVIDLHEHYFIKVHKKADPENDEPDRNILIMLHEQTAIRLEELINQFNQRVKNTIKSIYNHKWFGLSKEIKKSEKNKTKKDTDDKLSIAKEKTNIHKKKATEEPFHFNFVNSKNTSNQNQRPRPPMFRGR